MLTLTFVLLAVDIFMITAIIGGVVKGWRNANEKKEN